MKYVARIASVGADSYFTSSNLCLCKPADLNLLVALNAAVERAMARHNGYIGIETYEPFRPRRTGYRSGSAHFHGHCQSISDDTGNDFEDVKLYLKRRAMRRGYPAQTTKDGKIRYSLVDGLPLPQSEAKASIEQENMLIEEAHQLGAELGVTLIEYEEGNK